MIDEIKNEIGLINSILDNFELYDLRAGSASFDVLRYRVNNVKELTE